MSKPVLYSYFRSSASWRVRIVLAHKKIDYDYSAINLIREGGGDQFKEDYLKLNPIGHVPSLSIDGHVLTQSLPIIEYLEETRPENPILPKDSIKRCKVRQLAELINSGIQPIQNLGVLVHLEEVTGKKEIRAPWAKHFITKGLNAFEKLVSSSAGKFCVGDELSLADVCLIPQLLAASRNGVDMNQFPTIQKIAKHCETLECFKKAHPDNQPDAK